MVAVINLDAIAGDGPPHLAFGADRPRQPAARLVRTASAAHRRADASRAARARAPLAQLVDLAFPFSLYEQAPFVDRGIAAITLTSAGNRPPPAFGDSDLNGRRLAQIGRAAQALLGSLDEGVEGQAEGTSSYVYLGSRIVRGWAIVLVLCAALLPCLAVIVDLFARLRRRHIPLLPALRSYRSRLAFWIFAALLFELFSILGIWETGAARPLAPELSPGTDWPVVGPRPVLVRPRRGLALRARPPAAAPACRRRGCARRPDRRSARAGRHLARARRDEPVLGPARASLAPRLDLAATGAAPVCGAPGRSAGGRVRRPVAAARLVCLPVRPRPGRAVVPRRARCDRLRPLCLACSWSAPGSRSPRS